MPHRFKVHPLIPVLIGLLLVLLCFAKKAIHIDDPLYIWTAEQIRKKPLDFYGFDVNWFGTLTPMYESNYNPPFCAYYLALIMVLFGSSELALHTGFCLPTLMLVVGIYLLAKPICKRPILAVFLTILSPIFLVSATTLMCDVPMLMWWVWSIVFWRKGLEGNRWLLLVGGLLAGLAILTKYNAILLLPILALMAIQDARGWRWSVMGLMIPLGMLLAYERYTASLYGKGLFQMASGGVGAKHQATLASLGFHTVTCLAFLGAGVSTVSLTALRAWSWKAISTAIGGALLLALGISILNEGDGSAGGTSEHWKVPVVLQVVAWGVLGLGVLATYLRACWSWRDRKSAWLSCWIGSGILYSTLVNWMVSGRSLLPIVPACAIMAARWIDDLPQEQTERWKLWIPIGTAGLLAMFVTKADFNFANSVQKVATEISAQIPTAEGRPVWFLGHWGFQYYMEKLGCQPLDLRLPAAKAGDWLVTPYNNVTILMLPPEVLSENRSIKARPYKGLAVMQVDAGAGFYSSRFGPLPFVFGMIPEDVYYVQRLKQPLHAVME